MVRFSACLIILSLAVFSPVSDPAIAKEIRISNLIVTNTRDDLLLYLTIEDSFPESITAAIHHGIPTTFSFFVVLYQTRSAWFDKKLVDLEITHTIRYNSLKKEYVVERSWDTDKIRIVKTFDEARELMTDIEGMKIISLSQLEKGRQYRLLAKVRLKKATLPLALHHVLLFMSFWDVETDWYSVDFIF
jgi:hypothetical protein